MAFRFMTDLFPVSLNRFLSISLYYNDSLKIVDKQIIQITISLKVLCNQANPNKMAQLHFALNKTL